MCLCMKVSKYNNVLVLTKSREVIVTAAKWGNWYKYYQVYWQMILLKGNYSKVLILKTIFMFVEYFVL